MRFNQKSDEQVQEVYFSKKTNNKNCLHPTFNNAKVVAYSNQKHLGHLLKQRQNFNEYIQNKMNYEVIGVIKRLSVNLPHDALSRICKSFIRLHMDYSAIIYNKPNKESFKIKIENIQ